MGIIMLFLAIFQLFISCNFIVNRKKSNVSEIDHLNTKYDTIIGIARSTKCGRSVLNEDGLYAILPFLEWDSIYEGKTVLVIGLIKKVYDKDDPAYNHLQDSIPENERLAICLPSRYFTIDNAHWQLYP